LTGKRRIGRADAFAGDAVAYGAGGNAAARRALQIDDRRRRGGLAGRRRGSGREGGVPGGDGASICVVQPAGDLAHHRVLPNVGGVVLHLLVKISRVQSGQPRRGDAVAFAPEAMAGEAGDARSAFASAHGDDLAVPGEGLAGLIRGRRAGAGRDQDEAGGGDGSKAR
jgi:hypothetical protein